MVPDTGDALVKPTDSFPGLMGPRVLKTDIANIYMANNSVIVL